MKRRKILAAVLACMFLCMSLAPAAIAAEGDTPGYLIKGSAADGIFTLEIQVENAFAYTGRIGLVYDTSKLTHQGGNSTRAFRLASGVTATTESLPAASLISSTEGYIGTAWYCSGLDSLEAPATLATVDFSMKNGVTAEDIDASTFRLRVIEGDSMDPWTSPASIQIKGTAMPVVCEYLTDRKPINVTFDYDGSDVPPADGKTIRFRCANVLDEPVPAELTLGGNVYTTDAQGILELSLAPGAYQYRAVTEGYGDVNAVVTVTSDQEVPVTFVSDEDLVAQATNELEIGYMPGDGAERVTGNIALEIATDTGVTISWLSNNPYVISKEGFVFLPEETGVNVTLTATLTRGSVTATKTFTVYVCSEDELKPPVIDWGDDETPEEEIPPEEIPEEVPPPVTAVGFTDLAGFDWAKDAISRMATAGIIKGTSETTFDPSANIKRGDFVLLLMRMFNVDAAGDIAFDDVPSSSYYFTAIAQARTLGIAQGTGDNRFNPEAPITRQEMITFVMRALDKTGYLTVSAARNDLNSFIDKDLVEDYAFESLSAAVAQGFIVGSEGKLNPTGNTTRAEAAVLVARIYDAHNS